MSELKPCPFCGGEAETKASRYEPIELTLWSVRCKTRRYDGKQMESCVASNSIVMYATEAEAIEAWNTRHERTCRNASENKYSGDFVCSECSMTMDLSGDECGYGSTMMFFEERKVGHRKKHELVRTLDMPNYCPSCGAKVVE